MASLQQKAQPQVKEPGSYKPNTTAMSAEVPETVRKSKSDHPHTCVLPKCFKGFWYFYTNSRLLMILFTPTRQQDIALLSGTYVDKKNKPND